MRIPTIVILLALCHSLLGQNDDSVIEIRDEKTVDGLTIYATNKDILPYTIELDITQKNLQSNLSFPAKIVVEPTLDPVPIAVLTKKNPTQGWSYSSRYTFYRGDYRSKHEDDYAYALPFAEGKEFVMSQGYGGSFSHQEKKAIDFTMPEGTKILSARDGIVVKVKEDSKRGCPDRSCMDMANMITIMHEDGSFAEYVHLKKNGSTVKVGDRVNRGEHIGYSGATGFASGPHLHFEVYLPSRGATKTVATYFETAPGQKERLQERQKYEAF